MSEPLADERIIAALVGAGLLEQGEAVRLTPLSGGVSCDVMTAKRSRGDTIVVKRALSKLRVAADWRAPPERAQSEVRWLRLARQVDPRLAPEVLADMPAEHLFAMIYLDPAQHPVWKAELMAGRVDVGFAGAVGRDLARIHAATAGRAEVEAQFRTDDLFMALRIDPFLLYVADRNAAAAPRLRALASDLQARKTALAHGDISPKNILMGPEGPVFIDAECAVYGDPAFDLAFCLTHLLIKAVYLKDHAGALVASFDALWKDYGRGIDWEPREDVSARAAGLVAALLLARVDGKSPAPYLEAAADKDLIRSRGMALLADASLTLDELSRQWRAA